MQFFRNPISRHRGGLFHIVERLSESGFRNDAHDGVFSFCGGHWKDVEIFESEIEKVNHPLCQNCLSNWQHKEERERRKAEKLQKSICRTHIRPDRWLTDLQKAGWYEAMGKDKRYEDCPFCKGFKLKDKQ